MTYIKEVGTVAPLARPHPSDPPLLSGECSGTFLIDSFSHQIVLVDHHPYSKDWLVYVGMCDLGRGFGSSGSVYGC